MKIVSLKPSSRATPLAVDGGDQPAVDDPERVAEAAGLVGEDPQHPHRGESRGRSSARPVTPGSVTGARLVRSETTAKRSPDQVSSIAATLKSTRPLASPARANGVLGDVGGHARGPFRPADPKSAPVGAAGHLADACRQLGCLSRRTIPSRRSWSGPSAAGRRRAAGRRWRSPPERPRGRRSSPRGCRAFSRAASSSSRRRAEVGHVLSRPGEPIAPARPSAPGPARASPVATARLVGSVRSVEAPEEHAMGDGSFSRRPGR